MRKTTNTLAMTVGPALFLFAVLGGPALDARAEEAKPAETKPADGAAPATAKITYDEHVRPILREHCFTCHNADTKKSDLSLATFAAAMQGGSTGAVIQPGDADSSRLWALVSHAEEPKMPPSQDKLPAAKLDTIKAWITGGALENNGSVAKVKKSAAMSLNLSVGAAKPEGPPPMPEKLSRQPAIYTPRASSRNGPGRQPLGSARGRGWSEANRAVSDRHRAIARRTSVSRGGAARP